MKSQKGITLTSLVLYIMLVLIVLGILSVITASFQSNLKEVNKEGTKNSEVDSFNMYFLQEVKKQGNKINTISENEILFTTGNKFSFRENMIYLNDNIKIAENIENCAFSDSLENGKTVITVIIKAKDAEERSIEYVLSNEGYSSSYEDENNYIYEENNGMLLTMEDFESGFINKETGIIENDSTYPNSVSSKLIELKKGKTYRFISDLNTTVVDQGVRFRIYNMNNSFGEAIVKVAMTSNEYATFTLKSSKDFYVTDNIEIVPKKDFKMRIMFIDKQCVNMCTLTEE